jgi:signal transduction histidine kinase
MEAQRASADAALAASLRRIRFVARVAAGVWIVVAAVGTVDVSDRVLTAYLADAAERAAGDTTAVAHIVDGIFHELATIAHVLSSSREMRAVVASYNARGEAFASLQQQTRAAQLQHDPAVSSANQRLTRIRKDLDFDLISILDAHGIRIVSSDWDRPLSLLGVPFDDQDYFKTGMAKRASQTFGVARTTGNPVLMFADPIEDGVRAIGVVVVRQDSDAIGAMLAGGRRVAIIVDAAGMVVASSQTGLTLRHVGPLADTRPDDRQLRDVYAQEALRTLDLARPRRLMHPDEWVFERHPYLLKRAKLGIPGYDLIVLSPIERLEAARPLHYAIGVLAALFGVLAARLGDRRAEGLARRRHDAELSAAYNEELKSLNEEKDRYLGIAAHDLRNPLSSTRGLAEIMLETQVDAEQQRDFLDTIRRTSDEMLGLVNDLLDTSVIESGKLDLRRADLDVSKLLGQRLRHLEPPARKKQITLKVDAAQALHASVDAARFSQVVDNLITNAIKFSPPGATVTVALRPAAGGFAFSVQDQGPGIAEEDRKLLFRSFQKLSARPTGGEKSTGLGLAIVKKIVDVHGGQIDVDGAPGEGARFTVTMPSMPAGA